MFPPVFQRLKASAYVLAIVGDDPPRIYEHGNAPQRPDKLPLADAYISWFAVAGYPENHLSGTPPTDRVTVQVDCWAPTSRTVKTLAVAARDALEPYAHMTSIPVDTRETDTKLFRIALQFDWFVDRTGSVPAPAPSPEPSSDDHATPKVVGLKYSNSTSGAALTTDAATLGKFKWLILGWDMPAGSVTGYANGHAAIRAAAAARGNPIEIYGYLCMTDLPTSETADHTTPTPLYDSGKKRLTKVREVRSDGYDWTNRVRSSSAVGITRSGSTATVAHVAHGYTNGQDILIRGATQTEYNGRKTIAVVNVNSYTYAVSDTPATPATGTIYAFAACLTPYGSPGANYTRHVAVDGDGKRYPQWYAGYADWAAAHRMGLDYDGWFIDNTHYWGGTADWDHDPATANTSVNSSVGSGSSPAADIRQGHRDFIDALLAIDPTKLIVGNGQPNANSHAVNFHQSAELDQSLNGVMYEAITGEGYSDWGQLGWSVVLANLNTYQAACKSPKRVVATYKNIPATDYRQVRLALCLTLMTDAYAHICNGYATTPTWYDEYEAELGDPIDAVPSAALTGTIWGRKYANGYVLVNVGAGQVNSSDSVTNPGVTPIYTGLPADVYKRLTGTQDPAVNSGAVVSGAGVSVPTGDGVVLLCVTEGVHS